MNESYGCGINKLTIPALFERRLRDGFKVMMYIWEFTKRDKINLVLVENTYR